MYAGRLSNLVAAGVAVACAAAAPEPRRPTWMEQVERDRDRGAGRIVDDQNWELDRLRDQRDERMGILRSRREFERLDEERDRRLQIEARDRREALRERRGLGASAADQDSVILGDPPAGLPTLAAVVAKDRRALSAAKEQLERSLRATDAAEARELRQLRRRLTREGRAGDFEAEQQELHRRFEATRASHRETYERVRSRITGKQ